MFAMIVMKASTRIKPRAKVKAASNISQNI
jgi:hypothetical protein